MIKGGSGKKWKEGREQGERNYSAKEVNLLPVPSSQQIDLVGLGKDT